MGRRALPKLKSDVAYQHLLGSVRELAMPFHPDSLFATSAELEIEIGSGKGLFLGNTAAANPHRNFLGIEIAQKYARYAAYRLAAHGCRNVYVLAGDGLALFRQFLPDACAVAVHVYFPDPWWKERHRKRRVIQPGFVADVARVLRPGGVLHFWTDVEEYYTSACELIAQSASLQGPHPVDASPADHDMDYRTHFERRMRRNDQTVFRCFFEKLTPTECVEVDVASAEDQSDAAAAR